VDLQGLCLYPIIDRPCWDTLSYYHKSGLWDIDPKTKARNISSDYLKALLDCIEQYSVSRELLMPAEL